jgi:hypothetical protein
MDLDGIASNDGWVLNFMAQQQELLNIGIQIVDQFWISDENFC